MVLLLEILSSRSFWIVRYSSFESPVAVCLWLFFIFVLIVQKVFEYYGGFLRCKSFFWGFRLSSWKVENSIDLWVAFIMYDFADVDFCRTSWVFRQMIWLDLDQIPTLLGITHLVPTHRFSVFLPPDAHMYMKILLTY